MRIGAAAGVLASVFLLVYLPDAGHGFVKDDFAWIDASRVTSWQEAVALLRQNVGFYRPLVAATFAIDHAFWQLNPFGYGISNVLLAAADALLLFLLARRLSLAAPAALAAAAVWALNFHGVNMAILWLSGRTSLLLVLFALLTALACLRQRRFAAGALCLAAMLCKEEAVLLPLLWTLFAAVDRQSRGDNPSGPRRRLRLTAAAVWPMWIALLLYALLRVQSGAFSASDAPDYYQFTFDPAAVARNIAEYADRAGTLAAAIAIVYLAGSRWRISNRAEAENRAVVLGVLWCVTGYGLTVFLPLRSSLYALMPSIGCALIAGAAASLAWRTHPAAFRRVSIALVALAVLLAPVYRARNVRWVAAADLSSELRLLMEQHAARHPAGGTVVLIDDSSRRINFGSTFDSQFPKAATMFMGPRWSGGIDDAGGTKAEGATVRIRLEELVNSRR